MTREQSIKTILILPLLFCFFLAAPLSASSADETTAVSSDQNILTAQGKVRSFDPEKQLLLLKTDKGEKLTISTNQKTALVGYSSLQEIEKKHGLKIWYAVEAGKNVATKIEKKLDTDC